MIRLIAIVAVIGFFYFAGTFLIPLAMAILISLALAPVISRIERFGVPTVLAVGVVATLTFAALGGLGYVVTQQLVEVAESLPRYRENIESRLRFLRAGSDGGVIGDTARMVGEIQEEIEQEAEQEELSAREGKRRAWWLDPAAPAEGDVGAEPEPVLVRIQEDPLTTPEVIQSLIGPIFSPLATAAVVIVFVIFFLIQRRDLRERVVRLAGSRLDVTTQAMDEATQRISRFLLAQVSLNTFYGLPLMLGLWLVGVPGAVLWGVLSGVLRFIPYVGPWVSAALPILVSFAVFEGWTWPLVVIGLFIGMELFSNNVLEPWIYGSSSGLSAVAVIVAAVFWGWLWGPVGLLLAVPLTVCLLVLGKYLPALAPLTILLGREPALSPDARFYQRTLAGDEEEVHELVESFREEHGVIALLDQVILPALRLKERDHHSGRLDAQRAERVQDDLRSLVDSLVEWFPPGSPPPAARSFVPGQRTLLCLPARDETDGLSARLLAHVTLVQGMEAIAFSASALAGEMLQKVEEIGPRLVCICALPPAALQPARYLCLRLRKAFPDLRILVGLWNWQGDLGPAAERLREAGADQVVTGFAEALARTSQILDYAPTSRSTPEPTPQQSSAPRLQPERPAV